jgi:hypothetical protein
MNLKNVENMIWESVRDSLWYPMRISISNSVKKSVWVSARESVYYGGIQLPIARERRRG